MRTEERGEEFDLGEVDLRDSANGAGLDTIASSGRASLLASHCGPRLGRSRALPELRHPTAKPTLTRSGSEGSINPSP